MKYLLTARSGDWHLTTYPKSGVWACGRSLGEALRQMQRCAVSHDLCTMDEPVEVVIADDNWTQRVIMDCDLIRTSNGPASIHETQDFVPDETLVAIRDERTDDLHSLARCPSGYFPMFPDDIIPKLTWMPKTAFETYEAFGIPMARLLPDRWLSEVPLISVYVE